MTAVLRQEPREKGRLPIPGPFTPDWCFTTATKHTCRAWRAELAPVCSEGLRRGREGGWRCLLGRLGAAGRQSAQDQGEPALSPVLPSWQDAIRGR